MVLALRTPRRFLVSSFLYGPRFARSALPPPRANIPQYGLRARLVSGYYFFLAKNICQLCNKWKSLPEGFMLLV